MWEAAVFANSIYDACAPDIIADLHVEKIRGKSVIVVDVLPGTHEAYHLKRNGLIEGTYVRLGSETRHAGFETIQGLLLEGARYSDNQSEQHDIKITEEEVRAICDRLTAHARSTDWAIPKLRLGLRAFASNCSAVLLIQMQTACSTRLCAAQRMTKPCHKVKISRTEDLRRCPSKHHFPQIKRNRWMRFGRARQNKRKRTTYWANAFAGRLERCNTK